MLKLAQPISPVKLTLKQRIWAMVRNHPGQTAVQIAACFTDASLATVTSALSQLDLSDTVYSKGAGYKTDPKKYFTKLEHYTTKTVTRTPTPFNVKALDIVVPVPVVITPAIPNIVDQILEGISLVNARELHKKLNELFGH